MTAPVETLVLGAGPAGLGAAWRLATRGFGVTVLERNAVVGGNAGSFDLDGLRVDYGSHRLHPACSPAILADIRRMLGDDLLDRPRHGRIRLRRRWVHFPLKPVDLALNLPPSFVMGAAIDALGRRRAGGTADSFADVLEQGLGATICRDFYFPYAEKIWGRSPYELDAEQARRRVSAGSVTKLVQRVLGGVAGRRSGAKGRFFYPRRGYGQISEAYRDAAVQAGARLHLQTPVAAVTVEAGRVTGATVQEGGGRHLPARVVISTIPLPQLVRRVRPAAPPEVAAAADGLQSRAMLLIYLVLDTDRFSEYDAHYFPGPDIAITRLSEPKNYGLASLPGTTVLCAELPCSPADEVWSASDEALGAQVAEGLAAVDLPVRVPIRRVVTRRLREAYPIYTRGYRDNFDRLDRWVGGIEGLLTIGRQGLFAHDNTHHTLAMAYAASDSLDADGRLDATRWTAHRQAFETHVVED